MTAAGLAGPDLALTPGYLGQGGQRDLLPRATPSGWKRAGDRSGY